MKRAVVITLAAFMVVTMATRSEGQSGLSGWISKWITVPASNETKQVPAVQLWEVRWTSRYDVYSHSTRPEMEAFPTEAEAQAFATALRNAFELIRHTSGARVEVRKAR
jgi:hypothetical protein